MNTPVSSALSIGSRLLNPIIQVQTASQSRSGGVGGGFSLWSIVLTFVAASLLVLVCQQFRFVVAFCFSWGKSENLKASFPRLSSGVNSVPQRKKEKHRIAVKFHVHREAPNFGVFWDDISRNYYVNGTTSNLDALSTSKQARWARV
mmetsp:Transcript_33995/g.53062  ORF Transcript_33995/g.53062 Transcript_33995/m.53062 type:complete len:147 (+) Transcript_33995:142-582(+)